MTFNPNTSRINNQNKGYWFKMDHLDLHKVHSNVLFFSRENFISCQDHYSSRDLCLGSNTVCRVKEAVLAFGKQRGAGEGF